MPLAPGATIGHYEILEFVGAGGMGEVYRARDSKLGRTVAIKLVHERLASDSEYAARLQREARALAALNHPNIAAIYSFEHGAIVMEFVEGGCLPTPVPLSEAMAVARQIADALEAAHGKGIVHRDLKPANVRITPEGTVKVLDFGLAKTAGTPGPRTNPDSTTLTLEPSEPGAILGTAAYMSPEQAAGLPVDHRSDIWSFGAVFWEMLTGRKLFQGETAAHTLAEVLKAPVALDSLPPETPPGIRALIGRCLDRNLRTRLQHAGEARIAIEKTLAEPEKDRPARPRSLIWLAATAAVCGLAGWLAGRSASHWNGSPEAAIQSSILLPDKHVFRHREGGQLAALSPDGSAVLFRAYSGNKRHVFHQVLFGKPATPIYTADWIYHVSFAPGGRAAGIWSNEGLVIINVDGTGKRIWTKAGLIAGSDWTGDNAIVYAPDHGQRGLFVADGSGGTPRQVTRVDTQRGEESHVSPHFVSGNAIVFTVRTQEGQTSTHFLDLSTGRRDQVMDDSFDAQVTDSGHFLFCRGNGLYGAAWDRRRNRVAGPATQLLDDISIVQNKMAHLSVSKSGHVVYVPSAIGRSKSKLASVSLDGTIAPLLTNAGGEIFTPRFSPDGSRVAMAILGSDGMMEIWLFETASKALRKITFSRDRQTHFAHTPVWTRDGRALIFWRGEEGKVRLTRKTLDGGEEQFISSPSPGSIPNDISPDGRWLVYEAPGTGKRDIWLMDLMDEKFQAKPLLSAPHREAQARFSPDGKWITYVSDETGRDEVYVRRFPDLSGQELVSNGGGRFPVWDRSGKRIVYRLDDKVFAVRVLATQPWKTERPVLLFEHPFFSNNTFPQYDAFPDGNHLLMIQDDEPGAVTESVVMIRNWFQEVRSRVPVP